MPSEPADGEAGSAWIFLRIGEDTIKRRFWSDNSLNNVSHFVQSNPATFEVFAADEVPEAADCSSRAVAASTYHPALNMQVQLVNMTTYPPSILDLEMDGSRTLQARTCTRFFGDGAPCPIGA